MRRLLIPLLALFLGTTALAAPPAPVLCCGAEDAKAEVKADAPKKGGRGHKAPAPEVLKKRHADAFARHGHRMKKLPKASAASFDCRAMGWVLPVNDQGQCGDCFGISSIDACACAFVKAGLLPNAESSRWSGQYGLDCGGFQGGCDGGDEAQVIDYAKTNGFPLTADYGPYTAAPGRCKNVDSAKLLKIADWGFCTPSQEQGVAATEDIKNAMVAHGPISVAFDASECDAYQWPQTMTGRGTGVDHAVLCIAWDDAHDNGDGTRGAFLGLNQWGQWGGEGAFWVKYGADSWGTEAIWVTASALPPPGPTPPGPTPPGPTPPGPTPPVPPAPVTAGFTGTLTYANGQLVSVDAAPVTVGDIVAAALSDPKVATVIQAKKAKVGEAAFGPILVKIIAAVVPVVVADLAAGKTPKQIIPDVVAAILLALA